MENALVKKLKIKEGRQVILLNAPVGFKKEMSPLPSGVKLTDRQEKESSMIILFVNTKADLEKQIPRVLANLAEDGLIWFCFPKGSSGIQTDLTRDKGWESLSQFNLTHITLIAVNEQWSGFAVRRTSSTAKPKSQDKGKVNTDISRYVDVVNKMVTLPPFLSAVLKGDKKAYAMYDSLSYTNRKEYVVWILEAKQDETRQKRIKLMLEKLKSGLKNPSDKGTAR